MHKPLSRQLGHARGPGLPEGTELTPNWHTELLNAMGRMLWVGAIVSVVLAAHADAETRRIEVKAGEFSATKYLAEEQRDEVRKRGILKHCGEAEYEFAVPQAGWYELWVEAAQWATDLYLDGEFLIHTPFASGVWEPRGRLEKVVNLFLAKGQHTLKLSRTWHPGLPWMRRFVLEPAGDVTGMVRLVLQKDRLCFRRGEPFPVLLRAGRRDQAYPLTLTVVDTESGEPVKALEQTVPAGDGLFELGIYPYTGQEGVFDLKATDSQGRPVDRAVQYLVIDTKTPPAPPGKLEKELVQIIDCAGRKPDYAGGETRVLKWPLGSYRESGDRGHVERGMQADWFAYTLELPSVQEPYLVEIDYPDDDQRTFTYSVIERDLPGGRALTHGVASGGVYPLSGKMQTAEMVFYPRQRDPRLHFRTWWTGQRAAVAEIRAYRITSGFPPMFRAGEAGGRHFGRYQEEPLRFVQWGGRPEGNQWRNLWDAAERIGQFSRCVGVNLWHPTIAIYGAVMWPSRHLPSLDHDADGWATVGPTTLKEPLAKDTLRLLLLVGEKYGMDLVGELFMPAGRPVARRYFEERFGGDGEIEWKNPTKKPWLIVHRNGGSPGTPLYNPLYPGMQDWVADVVRELAERYRDSPAFKGVAIRFMGWQFHGWQGFPSIDWGYGDYTVGLFEKETGTNIPVDDAARDRFAKRYDWLMANAYEKWVRWRCERVYRYHARLAKVLTDSRPGLRLFLDLHGPTFGGDLDAEEWDMKGWEGLIREAGIDPALCRRNPAIVVRERRHYPPGIRGTKTKDPLVRAARIDEFYDPTPIEATARPADGGTVSAVHFDANSFESDMVKVEHLGLGEHLTGDRRRTKVHGAGLVFPAGRHFLERYAHAMADGNMTSVTDGSHGYIMWPPRYLREFTAEYRALPDIGMTKLRGTGDPVALWHGPSPRRSGFGRAGGKRDGRLYFYLVNRVHYPVEVEVSFRGGARVRRLATGEAVRMAAGRTMRMKLKPYELAAFVDAGGAVPAGLRAVVPEPVRRELQAQITFVEKLLSMEDIDETIIPFSLVDLQRAKRKLSEAREAYEAGRYWTVRRLLMHRHLVKVYDALAATPPKILHQRAPRRPEGALDPGALLRRAAPADRVRARVVPAARVEPSLAGEQVLAWQDGVVELDLDAPLTNRYRLSFAYLSRSPCARPAFVLHGDPVPGQDREAVEENERWGRLTVLPPLRLTRDVHRFGVQPRGEARAGLLYVHLEPLHRDIVAREWMVAGPFPSEPRGGSVGTGMEEVYPPERERDYTASYRGDEGKAVSWMRPGSDSDYVDLYELTGAYAHSISYAATAVESPQARLAELRLGVDYWARIWLNGEKVFEITTGHGAPREEQFTVPVELRKGVNELFMKIHAGSRGNGFWLSISDPGDLKVRPPYEREKDPA